MDKSAVESRNRHSLGLAPAGGGRSGTGTVPGNARPDAQPDVGALGLAKPVPIWAEYPVKRVASAGRDKALTGSYTHRTTGRLPSWYRPLRAQWLGAALAVGLLAAPALAQTVPLPKPAPKARDNTQMSAAKKTPLNPATTVSKPPPEPVIPDPRRNV